jgi:anti-anti-sigma factor
MTTTVSSQELRVERVPGDFGPVLRFFGDLSAATKDTLHKELAIASAEGAEREHASPAVTVNVSDCRFEEVEGVLALLDGARRLRRDGHRLILVAGSGKLARWLQFAGIDRAIPTFPTEETAGRALRGGRPCERD